MKRWTVTLCVLADVLAQPRGLNIYEAEVRLLLYGFQCRYVLNCRLQSGSRIFAAEDEDNMAVATLQVSLTLERLRFDLQNLWGIVKRGVLQSRKGSRGLYKENRQGSRRIG